MAAVLRPPPQRDSTMREEEVEECADITKASAVRILVNPVPPMQTLKTLPPTTDTDRRDNHLSTPTVLRPAARLPRKTLPLLIIRLLPAPHQIRLIIPNNTPLPLPNSIITIRPINSYPRYPSSRPNILQRRWRRAWLLYLTPPPWRHLLAPPVAEVPCRRLRLLRRPINHNHFRQNRR